jgi:hypothetical protein
MRLVACAATACFWALKTQFVPDPPFPRERVRESLLEFIMTLIPVTGGRKIAGNKTPQWDPGE